MALRDARVEGGRRGFARMSLVTLVVSAGFLMSCARQAEPGPSKEEIWQQIYASRLENLRALDQAFNELGQEYYKLEIEYKNAGRDDLASISRERAKAFHEQHLQFQQRLAELERIDGRLRRGESALDIQASREAEEPSGPLYTGPSTSSAPPAPAPSPEAYRPPSSSGYATPARTPTPSPSGLGAPSGSRFNDPIIITDPKLNTR